MDNDQFGIQEQTPDQSVRKLLNKMFTRVDYVGVKNITKKPFVWVVALEQNEFVNLQQNDPMQEDKMAAQGGGTFLPNEAVTRNQQRVTKYELKPGEKKMIIGEAAYVIAQQIFNKAVREKYTSSKAGLARLRNPVTQKELLGKIIEGPIINNVGDAMNTYVNDKMNDIENAKFSDVQTAPPAGQGQNYTPKATSGAKS